MIELSVNAALVETLEILVRIACDTEFTSTEDVMVIDSGAKHNENHQNCKMEDSSVSWCISRYMWESAR
jgi:hypothetical protein